ncbi:IS607 family element RNA-guided endonuclease TnpB, partial [Streptomyces sp. NPDC002599]
VAGDQDTALAVSKPRGADRKTRATRPRRKAEAGRAGGATLPHQQQTETGDRPQAEPLTLW